MMEAEEETGAKSGEVITITRAQAMSAHVNDLLKRQMSLRGETGITRDSRRRWFYQNWFIFSVVSAVAALSVWAIIEPYFNDLDYLQGSIEEINRTEPMPGRFTSGSYYFEPKTPGQGWIKIKGQKIWLLETTAELRRSGRPLLIDQAALDRGLRVGVYVDFQSLGGQDLAFAHYVDTAPPDQSAKEGALTLAQLHSRSEAAGWFWWPLLGAFIGLAIGAADGLVCRLWRRALLAGAVGLLVGFIGSFISSILAHIIYGVLARLAMTHTGTTGQLTMVGFLILMIARALGWALAGMTMGLGQGIALRSKRLLLWGFLGGVIGGVIGGLLFDPIYFFISGASSPSAHWSRLIGFTVNGICIGAMIGVVELLTRDAWLRMTAGPLTGKEFVIFKDRMNVGSSPRSDIYLFNDPMVREHHATLRMVGDDCEIEATDNQRPILLNGRAQHRSRLRHGDQITIGRTEFVFEKRQG